MMRDDKLIELLEFYAMKRGPAGRLPDTLYTCQVEFDSLSEFHIGRAAVEDHAVWMATQAIGFVKEAQEIGATPTYANARLTEARLKIRSLREKAHRWLGFIQATLWMAGAFTLNELKEHSRQCSDDPEKAEGAT